VVNYVPLEDIEMFFDNFTSEAKAVAIRDKGIDFAIKPSVTAGIGAKVIKALSELAADSFNCLTAMGAVAIDLSGKAFSGINFMFDQDFSNSHSRDIVFNGDHLHGEMFFGVCFDYMGMLFDGYFYHKAPLVNIVKYT